MKNENLQIKKTLDCIIIFIAIIFSAPAQTPTVGLLLNDINSFDGYTLFAPNTFNKTYLIDNCGNTVNTWQSSYPPGLSAYLLPNGNLLRTAHISNSVFASGGGSGGRLELFDFSGNVIWSTNYSDNSHHQHHDVEFLPNGNILMIAWEYKSSAEAITAGRNPALLNANLWPDQVVEIEPTGSSSFNIIWEWHSWDHLIQDYDSSKANFGVVQDNPELININFSNSNNQDWMHTNSIDYNPLLDQILLSIHNFQEIWVIDHSTTTAEAAGHNGGNSGKGGDLLYRWGNPGAYNRGTPANQKFWGQHDAHWIEPGLHDEGKIMVFNNGINRPGGNSSSVDVLEPPLDSAGTYLLNGILPFGPDSLLWQYAGNPPAAFYSSNISGAQRLENGNTLICVGSSGNFFEIDTIGNTVWNYINPVNSMGPVNQGAIPTGNSVFRCTRYSRHYSGLVGQILQAGLPLELNPYPSSCQLYTSTEDDVFPFLSNTINIFPNPATKQFTILNEDERELAITIADLQGRIYEKVKSQIHQITLSTNSLPSGIYIISVETPLSYQHIKIIKI